MNVFQSAVQRAGDICISILCCLILDSRLRKSTRNKLKTKYCDYLKNKFNPKKTITYIPPRKKLKDIKIDIVEVQKKERIILFLPSINISQFSGGPNTALLFCFELAKQGFEIHCVSSYDKHCDTKTLQEHVKDISNDKEHTYLQFYTEETTNSLCVQNNDTIVATHHSTTYYAKKISHAGNNKPFIYFIQDFEPLFYAWGEEHADAMLSYFENYLPVINQKLLSDFYINSKIGKFAEKEFCSKALSFEPAVDKKYFFPTNSKKDEKRTLLFYARPSAPRNLFNWGLEALFNCVKEGILTNAKWRILCLGEPGIPSFDLGNNVITSTLPWLNFSEYSSCIRNASVGLSLMLSPHTSYMPLELAACDIPVVTTCYANKTSTALKAISPWIIGTEPRVECITKGIRKAVQASETQSRFPLHCPRSWHDAFAPVMPEVLKWIQETRAKYE